MGEQKTSSWEALEKTKSTRAPRMAPMPQGRPQKEEKVPVWIVAMFIFALAFCLFAVYKAFIFKQGYDFSNGDQPQVVNVNLEEELKTESSGALAVSEAQTGSQLSGGVVSASIIADRSSDVGVIQSFYQYMVANQLDQMNALVNAPLLRSKTWSDHWNAKNLGIFSRNLVGQLQLNQIFFIPTSVNAQKNSRQYSYTLEYTIQPDHHYQENWKVTLVTVGTGRVLISEIMCETKGCSRSPFFWPQNLGLK